MFIDLLEKLVNGYFAVIPRSLPKPIHLQQARVIAHRGAHHHASGVFENTIQAFQLAKEAQCWGIELDVQLTADQQFVVNHDSDLTRLWGQPVEIRDLSFNELRQLEPGIPSLDEVVQQFGKDLHLFIELKTKDYPEARLLQTLAALTPIDDYHLIALDDSYFKNLSQCSKQTCILVAIQNNIPFLSQLALNEDYAGMTAPYPLFTQKYIDRFKQANKVFGVGFVNSINCLYRELNREIYWIFTNQGSRIGQHVHDLRRRFGFTH
jgi:glycerophosphoryl diester phosphodiesterase